MNLSDTLLSTEKMELNLMLLLVIFGIGIGSMHFLTLGCLILLHVPILTSHCQGAIKFMNRRNVAHMMNGFGK